MKFSRETFYKIFCVLRLENASKMKKYYLPQAPSCLVVGSGNVDPKAIRLANTKITYIRKNISISHLTF